MDNIFRHFADVDESHSGIRLDTFLADFPYEEFDVSFAPSRSRIQKWISLGSVKVNGETVTGKSHRLKAGDRVGVEFPIDSGIETPPPENLNIPVVFEDDFIMVIDKPPGITSHPTYNAMTGSVVNFLYYRKMKLPLGSHPLRPGIVHRLDKNTSGLMIVAKTDRSMSNIIDMIKLRKVERNYLAIVFGNPPMDSGKIDLPIGRHERDRKKMAVMRSGNRGRPARTHYRVITRFPGFSLISCKLDTGRTHQIRVHLKHIGYPVAGDPKYGGRKAQERVDKILKGMSKKMAGYQKIENSLNKIAGIITSDNIHLLHAAKLSFPHPVTGETVSFKAEPHRKFLDVMNLLKTLPYEEAGNAV
ncbi:RluA family pseudouridine synthase [bacterium]|nr:RluA family pseudouridine synthase [bacterium]